MYIEAIILGVIIGMARNGRISNFFEVRFKGWGLSILAFLLFLVPYGIKVFGIGFENVEVFPFASMVVIAIITLLNFEKTGMKIIFLGLALNLVIMGLNGFQMPIDTLKMTDLGFHSFVESLGNGEVVNYTTLEGAHSLSPFLGKVIELPKAYPLAKVLSLGDVLISLGIVVLIQYEMLLSSLKSKGSMVQFSYNSKIR